MLDDRPRYTIQEIANELITERHQLDYGLLVYLQDGLLKSYIEYPPYLQEQGTELPAAFWRKYTIDTIDLRPNRRKVVEFRIPGYAFYDRERERLESIRNAALKADPALIDNSLQSFVALNVDSDNISRKSGKYSLELIHLLSRLKNELKKAEKEQYVVYVSRDEWQSFRDTNLSDPKERKTKRKTGAPQNVYWREIYEEVLIRLILRLAGQSVHEFLEFKSRKELAAFAVEEARKTVEIIPGTQLPKVETVSEELGKLERRAPRDKSTD